MTDYSKLKELAEAATDGVWVATGLDQGCAQVVQQDNPWQTVALAVEVYPECVIHMCPEDATYIAAVHPAVVLGLIAENERLMADLRDAKDAVFGLRWAVGEFKGERDRLKAECEGLRKTLTDVRETVQREYWDEYAGLDDTRAILDSALGAESSQ